MAANQEHLKDLSSEEKIKEAACTVFMQKGYAATRTRDIADAAGINLALLNYYFRSKENLFRIVMEEKVEKMFGIMGHVLNDPATSLQQKVQIATNSYFDMLGENPDLPIFVMSELRNQKSDLLKRIPFKKLATESFFAQQVKDIVGNIEPLQFIVSLLGLVIFPFIARPIISSVTGGERAFNELIEERRKLVPIWFKAMLKAK